MTTTSTQKKEWRSVRTKSEPKQRVCPCCGAGKVEEPTTALELAGNVACLIVMTAAVSFGLYGTSRFVHLQIDHFPARFLSPEHVDEWN